MPYHEITAIDKEVVVGPQGGTIYGFYTIPPDQASLYEILNAKRQGKIPKILRVRLNYRIEYVDPTPLTTASGGITIIDCNGNEVRPPIVIYIVNWRYPISKGEVDISNYFLCTAPAMGLNAVRVDLGSASYILPLPETKYRVKIIMKVSWGW